MENKDIILLQHSPLNIKYTNAFYINQTDDKDLTDYIVIDVTSRVERDKEFMKLHPTFAEDLSPFFIGPVTSTDGVTANIFEIFWQCGKVYPCHDDNGKPNSEFFKWRKEFYAQEKCSKTLMRHACESLGYKHSDTLYFAYYNKDTDMWEPLDYVTARKKVYFPEYIKLIYNSKSFKWLKSLLDSGKKIALVDFDAFNIYSDAAKTRRYNAYLNKCKENHITPTLTLDDFLNIKTIKDLVSCSFLPVGHGVAIKALLEGDLEVVDGEVIDHIGLLELI